MSTKWIKKLAEFSLKCIYIIFSNFKHTNILISYINLRLKMQVSCNLPLYIVYYLFYILFFFLVKKNIYIVIRFYSIEEKKDCHSKKKFHKIKWQSICFSARKLWSSFKFLRFFFSVLWELNDHTLYFSVTI